MGGSRRDGEEYLRQYPRLRKWVNQCVVCQAVGYRPDLPADLFTSDGNRTAAADNLRRYFRPLPVDELGRCEMCAPRPGDETGNNHAEPPS
jgi:hypothetical protein